MTVLTATYHGGDLAAASIKWGEPKNGWFDFSTSTNPLGTPPQLIGAIRTALENGALLRYPDPESLHLREVLAKRHNVSPDSIICGNGASELFPLACGIFEPGCVEVAVPSFAEYERAALSAGHEVLATPLGPHFSVRCPQNDQDIAGSILGHPNNPTSRLLDEHVLRAHLETGRWVIVDEAFIELTVDGESFIPLLAEYDRLIVIRSFTKSLSIPGLRLGYALAHPDLIAAMKKRVVPWSVNSLAQSIAPALNDVDDFLNESADLLSIEIPRVEAALGTIPGLHVYPADANFVLCRLSPDEMDKAMTVPELSRRLAQRGILIRETFGFRRLDSDRFFRIAIRTPKENSNLFFAIRRVLVEED